MPPTSNPSNPSSPSSPSVFKLIKLPHPLHIQYKTSTTSARQQLVTLTSRDRPIIDQSFLTYPLKDEFKDHPVYHFLKHHFPAEAIQIVELGQEVITFSCYIFPQLYQLKPASRIYQYQFFLKDLSFHKSLASSILKLTTTTPLYLKLI